MSEVRPRVSIIVPCYNGGRFLPSLIASLSAQTYNDFETVIVDDGSTDPATCDALSRLPASIRLIRQQNAGLPAARNAGFVAARASLILPLDCDDEILPSFLASALALLERQTDPERCLIFSDIVAHGARQGRLRRRFNRFDQLFLNQLPYAILLPKAAWAEVGGYDTAMRDGYEDWEFSLRLSKAGYRGVRLDEPLFRYYVRPDGMLLAHSARRHARLWRYIRKKHADLYGLNAILAARSDPRNEPPRVSSWLAILLLAGAMILPDALFSQLYRFMLFAKTQRNLA